MEKLSDIEQTVLSMVQAACIAAESEVEASLQTPLGQLGVDSLKLIEIVYHLESQYSVEADEELLAEMKTVGDIAQLFHEAVSS